MWPNLNFSLKLGGSQIQKFRHRGMFFTMEKEWFRTFALHCKVMWKQSNSFISTLIRGKQTVKYSLLVKGKETKRIQNISSMFIIQMENKY